MLLRKVVGLIAPSLVTLPLSSTIKLTLSYLIKIPRLVRISLPNRMKIYVPSMILNTAWNNVLHIYYYKDYELVHEYIPRRGWKVFDIGSFIGIWLLKVAQYVGSNGLVIGFEPNPIAYRIAYVNVKLNNLKNVLLSNYAIGDYDGVKTLYISEDLINSSFLKEYIADLGRSVFNRICTRMITLEKALKMYSVNKLDLVKIDVEGYEYHILSSSRRILKEDSIRRLIIEVHKNIVRPRVIMDLLEDLGWDVIYIDLDLEVQAFIYASKAE